MCQTGADMIGLNFYKKSKRYIDGSDRFMQTKKGPQRVGVFVQEDIEIVLKKAKAYNLDYIQCHGHESKEYCRQIQSHIKVIKVFSISKKEDFSQTEAFSFCDLFLFDTYTKDFGGSGQRFDWSLLKDYQSKNQFLLAGGIGPEDVNAIKKINHPQFLGVDINSKFEIEPGLKNEKGVSTFIKALK